MAAQSDVIEDLWNNAVGIHVVKYILVGHAPKKMPSNGRQKFWAQQCVQIQVKSPLISSTVDAR